jgi:hypothetical protein
MEHLTINRIWKVRIKIKIKININRIIVNRELLISLRKINNNKKILKKIRNNLKF